MVKHFPLILNIMLKEHFNAYMAGLVLEDQPIDMSTAGDGKQYASPWK